jgi:hypothetical protein
VVRRVRCISFQVQELLLRCSGVKLPRRGNYVSHSQEDAQDDQEELVLCVQGDEVARYGCLAISNQFACIQAMRLGDAPSEVMRSYLRASS